MMTEVEYGATKIQIEHENEEKLKHYPILQKQLEIAVKRLEFLKKKTSSPYYENDNYLKTIYQMCDKTLRQIEELNNANTN